ncbi:MAG: FG-GAP repeat protein, partial [Novosphingobium sp.]|nr:FG-GAP repeat protein [Novosphingobium sp.]
SVLTLTNPIPTALATFGRSVAMSGARVVVGAPGTSGGGNVFVYDLNNATPATPVLTIANPGPASGDSFGSVAVSGRWLVVGAPADDTLASNAGSVYVYDLDGVDPAVPVMTLNKPGAVASDSFGNAVAIFGTLVVTSATGDDTGASNAGSAYVFDLAGSTPTVPVAILNNPTPVSNDGFSNAVAISGMQVVIGASGDDTFASNAGSVYVYDLGSTTPLVPLTLSNPFPAANDGFGSAVKIAGTRLVVGAASDDLAAVNVGSVYVYELASASPEVPAFTLSNPAPSAGDFFGASLAVEGGMLIIGASGKDTPAYDAGAAYVFGPHPLDQDSDGMRDAWELTWWPGTASHGPLDDDDHDGLVNLLEMAFGLNPTVPNGGNLTPLTQEGGYLTMTIIKHPGAAYEVQSAGTLTPGQPESFSATTTTILLDDTTTLKVHDNTPASTATARFMRVRVTGAP